MAPWSPLGTCKRQRNWRFCWRTNVKEALGELGCETAGSGALLSAVPKPDGVQQLSDGKEKLSLPSQWTVKIIEKN